MFINTYLQVHRSELKKLEKQQQCIIKATKGRRIKHKSIFKTKGKMNTTDINELKR